MGELNRGPIALLCGRFRHLFQRAAQHLGGNVRVVDVGEAEHAPGVGHCVGILPIDYSVCVLVFGV